MHSNVKHFVSKWGGVIVLLTSLFLSQTLSSQVVEPCEDSPIKFDGESLPTSCDQYGSLSFPLQIGIGTPFPNASSIGNEISGNVHIIGDFHIDVDVFSFENAIVKIEPGKSIVVPSYINPSDRKISIIESHLFACDGMWNGILLGKHVSYHSENSSIEDALSAVSIQNGKGTLITSVSSVYNRNVKGFVLSGTPQGNSIPLFVDFSANTFSCTAPLNGTTDDISEVGIDITNVPVTIPSSAPNSFSDHNYGIRVSGSNCFFQSSNLSFDKIRVNCIYMEKGVLVLPEQVIVSDCYKKAIYVEESYYTKINGLQIYNTDNIPTPTSPSLPANSIYGIYINGASPSSEIDISNCAFNFLFEGQDVGKNGRAIFLEGSGFAGEVTTRIKTNIFNIVSDGGSGIFFSKAFPNNNVHGIIANDFVLSANPYKPTNPVVGIINNNTISNMRIGGNSFAHDEEAAGSAIYILLLESEGTGHVISGNSFFPGEFEVENAQFINMQSFKNAYICNNHGGSRFTSTGYTIFGDCTGSAYRENSTLATGVAIRFRQSGFIGPQKHAGNTWGPIYYTDQNGQTLIYRSNTQARHEGVMSSPNKFIVHTPQSVFLNFSGGAGMYDYYSPYHPEGIVPGNQQFFQIDPNGNPSNACSEQLVSLEINGLDSLIATQTLGEEQSEAIKWSLERSLFAKLSRNPALMNNNSLMQSYFASKTGTVIEKFFNIQSDLDSASNIPPEIFSQLEFENDNLNSMLNEIIDLDQLLLGQYNQSSFEDLVFQKRNLLEQISNVIAGVEILNTEYFENYYLNIDVLIQLNESIAVSTQLESVVKDYNKIYLENLESRFSELSSFEIETLIQLAEICNENDGEADISQFDLQDEKFICFFVNGYEL